MSTEGEITSDRNSTDSDVQLVQSSAQVIVVEDDDPVPPRSIESESRPLVTIHFDSSELYQKLEREVSAAIEAVFHMHLPSQCITLRPDSGRCILGVFEADTSDDVESTDSLFVVDSTPTKSKGGQEPIPSYKKFMNKVFDGQTPESSPNSSAKRARMKQTCWNCEGNHGLKDCKMPRNYLRIRQNKEEFQKKGERYHADLEQKYCHFVPGKLSRELSDALGLGSRDLPLHIYKMRQYGYPPGWLEDAKITHSGLQLFDSNGDIVQHSDDSDGDIEKARSKYDVRKIIAFPGFNDPPDGKMFDDYKFYNVPPYSEELSREQMIRRLEGTLVHGYRRKRLKLSIEENGCANIVDSTANMEQVDMDETEGSPQPVLPQPDLLQPEAPKRQEDELEDGELSDEAEKITDESVILVETPAEVITLDDTVVSVERSLSPSLDDLEKQQQNLVEQLADQSVDSTFSKDISLENISSTTLLFDSTMLPPPPPGPDYDTAHQESSLSIQSPPPPPPPPCLAEEVRESNAKPPEPETLDFGEIAMNKLPYLDDPGSVGLKKMQLGTPILRAFTPYTSLPSGVAFSKGVSDVINFENLPNSTGKYQRMKSLLSEVRQKINEHMNDMDDER